MANTLYYVYKGLVMSAID